MTEFFAHNPDATLGDRLAALLRGPDGPATVDQLRDVGDMIADEIQTWRNLEISKLELQSGDKVIVRVDQHLSESQMAICLESLRQCFPYNPVVLLPGPEYDLRIVSEPK